MGNRAIIATSIVNTSKAIYTHWNGGRDSIEGYLCYAKIKGVKTIEGLQEIMKPHSGAEIVGYGKGTREDNGVYLIDLESMIITARLYFEGREEQQVYVLLAFIGDVNNCQPEPIQADELERLFNDLNKKEVIS